MTHFLSESSVYCGTSFCLFSSFCQLAAAALTPGSLFGSHCRLLLPAAHIDTHRRLCPQGDPSCRRTIKRRGIGGDQNPPARFQGAACNGLSATMKSNQTERSAGRGCGHACRRRGWGGVMFPFPFLSSGECSGCWHAVTAGTFKNYCGRTNTNRG